MANIEDLPLRSLQDESEFTFTFKNPIQADRLFFQDGKLITNEATLNPNRPFCSILNGFAKQYPDYLNRNFKIWLFGNTDFWNAPVFDTSFSLGLTNLSCRSKNKELTISQFNETLGENFKWILIKTKNMGSVSSDPENINFGLEVQDFYDKVELTVPSAISLQFIKNQNDKNIYLSEKIQNGQYLKPGDILKKNSPYCTVEIRTSKNSPPQSITLKPQSNWKIYLPTITYNSGSPWEGNFLMLTAEMPGQSGNRTFLKCQLPEKESYLKLQALKNTTGTIINWTYLK